MYGVYFIIFWGGVQWEVAGERGTLGGQGRASLAVRRGGALPLPAGGEIAEALPVAEEARRFRGSAPIGSHNSGRESVGTTVGKRTPPLRTAWRLVRRADVGIGPYGRFDKKVPAWNPPVTALLCQPSLGKGPLKTRNADCHDQ